MGVMPANSRRGWRDRRAVGAGRCRGHLHPAGRGRRLGWYRRRRDRPPFAPVFEPRKTRLPSMPRSASSTGVAAIAVSTERCSSDGAGPSRRREAAAGAGADARTQATQQETAQLGHGADDSASAPLDRAQRFGIRTRSPTARGSRRPSRSGDPPGSACSGRRARPAGCGKPRPAGRARRHHLALAVPDDEHRLPEPGQRRGRAASRAGRSSRAVYLARRGGSRRAQRLRPFAHQLVGDAVLGHPPKTKGRLRSRMRAGPGASSPFRRAASREPGAPPARPGG